LILKSGRDKPVRNGHPWVFSGAVAKVDGSVEPGEIVHVCSADGTSLATAYYNPRSRIAARVFGLGEFPVDAGYLGKRLASAWELRKRTLDFSGTDAFRIVNAEGDFLPGLFIDKYADCLVTQFNTAGMERLRGAIIAALVEIFSPRAIIDRSEGALRHEEGLAPSTGALIGSQSEPIDVTIAGVRQRVSLRDGHKTGLYLDQASNLRSLDQYLRTAKLNAGARALNLFAYHGGFSIVAAHHGLTTTSVDTSAPALAQARENFTLNGLDPAEHSFIDKDCFAFLRSDTEKYSLIILDPPPFARKAGQENAAARGYKELHLRALSLLERDGTLFTWSCSQRISRDFFQKIIFEAAVDAGRNVRVIDSFGAGSDHPFSIFHPEGEYLKGFALSVE